MWFIGVEVEQETSAPPPKKNPGSAPACACLISTKESESVSLPTLDLKRAGFRVNNCWLHTRSFK